MPDGEWGEMVVTTLSKEAAPLIRYRTRDITRIIDPGCQRGRAWSASSARLAGSVASLVVCAT